MRQLIEHLERLGEQDGPMMRRLRVFSRQHPYHNDLDAIQDARETTTSHYGVLVGRHGVIDVKRARFLEKKGLVDVVSGSYALSDNFYVTLTPKGEKSLEVSSMMLDKI
jgi:hypothetical protein